MNIKDSRISLIVLLIGFACGLPVAAQVVYPTRTDTTTLFDSTRNRMIPVAVYQPSTAKKLAHQQLVILNHGYNANQPGSYLGYSYIANRLASMGYFVVSIQHELASDSLLPAEGIPQVVRRTNWERGVANILFVLNTYKNLQPALDFKHVILIGHSNGGDMCMLFAQKYPERADKIISLDNRRVAFPRVHHPHLYSLRSSDQLPDEGVLPTKEEQEQYGITVIRLKHTIHNDMGDNGTPSQQKEINGYIVSFLDK